ncbi:MAG TPA: ABC transporter substrate-binding protein, partial [Ruminiclostridium sp.]|nr:ABC transporter substrate-binding protein [Ruminiclostridium sp.]
MKKKILSLLLCMMMVASLAVGCGTKTENTQTNETSNGSNGEVTLTLWSIATESDAFHPAYT